MPKNKIRIATATALGIIGLVGVFETVQNNTTKAINPREKSELDIRFYDDQACGSTAASDCGEVTGVSEDDRLYSLLDHYAGLAQELQRQTGVPWELPFMHARGESGFCNTTFGDLKMLWDNYQSFNCFGLLESANGSYHMGATFNNEHSDHINQMGGDPAHYVQAYSSIADNFASFFYDYMRTGEDDKLVFDESKVKDVKSYYDGYFLRYTGLSYSSDYYSKSMGVLEKVKQYSMDKGWSSSAELAESIPLGGLFTDHGFTTRQQGWQEQSMHISCDGTVTDKDGKVYVQGGGDIVAKTKEKSENKVANNPKIETAKEDEKEKNRDQQTVTTPQVIRANFLDSHLSTKFYLATSTSGGSEDGLTEEQAQSLVDWYIDTAHNNELDLSLSLGTHCNCVSMSNYFIQKFTTLTFGSNDGYFVVDSTYSANPDKTLEIEYASNISKITIPSIFSDKEGSGHTGVIVGYDSATQEYISIEANWTDNSVKNDMMQIEGCGKMGSGKLNAGYTSRKTLSFYQSKDAKFLPIPLEYINQEALQKIANGQFGGSQKCGTNKAFTGDFPFMSQGDARWANMPYPPGQTGNSISTYKNSGCGITSFAMIATYLEGEEITPPDVYDRTGGVTYNGNPIGEMARFYNMEAINVTETDLGSGSTHEQIVATINKYLNDGYLIELSGRISSGSNGVFSDQGHYIVLYGRDSKGEWLMADPGHKDNNGKAWDPMKLVGMGIDRGQGETKIWAIKSAGE